MFTQIDLHLSIWHSDARPTFYRNYRMAATFIFTKPKHPNCDTNYLLLVLRKRGKFILAQIRDFLFYAGGIFPAISGSN